MKLTRSDVILTKIPTRRPHKMSIGTTTAQESVFLRLWTDDGACGWGEAPHMVGYSFAGETQSSVALQLRERLLPAVLGKDPRDIEARQRDMDRALPRNPRAKSAVNIALYDLVGRALGVSVSRLLGGVVRDRIPLSWSIGSMPPEEGAEEAAAMAAKGIGILKLKVGARERPDLDIEMARRVRAAVPNIRLRADANQAFDVPTAIRVGRAMVAEAGLESMEQPVAAHDLEGMAEVRRAINCYVMADESANTPLDVYEVARHRAADLVSIYINNGGGITAARNMAVVADAAGLKGYVGGALEGPIAARACLHFAASSPSVSFGCEMVGPLMLAEDVGTEPIAFEGGALVVPTSPGLGGDLDEAKVKRYELARFSVPAA